MALVGVCMDESYKRNRDVFEDEEELFGFEYIQQTKPGIRSGGLLKLGS